MDSTGALTATKPRILSEGKDWLIWLDFILKKTPRDLRPYIDPRTTEANVPALLRKPREPQLEDYYISDDPIEHPGQLPATQQRRYKEDMAIYDRRWKRYHDEQVSLQAIESLILNHIADDKVSLINTSDTARQWMLALKLKFAPKKATLVREATKKYREAIQQPVRGGKTFSQWIERWAVAMSEAVKWGIADIKSTQWLIDLADEVGKYDPAFKRELRQKADDIEELPEDEQEPFSAKNLYNTYERQLQDNHGSLRLINPSGSVRGSAFATLHGQEAPSSDEEEGRGRKRSATTTELPGQGPAKKLEKGKRCVACHYLGHQLKDCWSIFPEKIPKGLRGPSAAHRKKAEETVEADPKLQAQVDRLRKKDNPAKTSSWDPPDHEA